MRGAVASILAVSFLLVGADLQAQVPDFSGGWKLVQDRDATPPTRGARQQVAGRAAGGAIGAGLGENFTLTQTAETLTITRATPAGEIQMVHNLDGSPRENRVTMREREIVQRSTAKWEEGKLVIVTSMQVPGMDATRETTMTLSLVGEHLVVENIRPGRAGAEARTVTTRYERDG